MARFFDLFQIGSLAAFLLLFLGRALYLRSARDINPFKIGRGKAPAEALLEGALVVGLPLWLFEVLAFAWPLPWHIFPEPILVPVLDSAVARVAGCGLIAAGIALFASALVSFGDSWRVGIDRDTPGELVTSGVFSLTRNPIFVFMDAYTLGIFLLNGRLFFGLVAVVALASIHAQILREEAFLENRYGEAYRAYRAKTARYLGV